MKFSSAKLAAIAFLASALVGTPAFAAKPKAKPVPLPPPPAQQQVADDPLEPLNRAIFEFNDLLDKLLLKPVATIYSTILPTPVQDGVSNVFGNLDDVYTGVNNILQGKPERAGKDFGRVLVNTTLGIGGIFDVGSRIGLEKSEEDFGQTFGVWGVSPGPYIVLPVLGPSTARDAVGRGVRIVSDPRMYLPPAWEWSLLGVNVVSLRARSLRTEGLLEQASFDRYGFVRSSYLMRREALVRDALEPGSQSPGR